MSSLNRIIKKGKDKKRKKVSRKIISGSPQKKGVCRKFVERTPRKPNSATRNTAKVYIFSKKRLISAYIPGIAHTLQKNGNVLIRGGGGKDIPGMQYSLIRGKFDFHGIPGLYRKQSRSRYGVKFNKEIHRVTEKDKRYIKKRFWS